MRIQEKDFELVTEDMEQVRNILENQIIEDVSGRSTTIVDLSYLPILGSFLLGMNKIYKIKSVFIYFSRFAFKG